ncbi:MAG: hypothetical protein AABZ39_00200 [Spirochaetota bacterium]
MKRKHMPMRICTEQLTQKLDTMRYRTMKYPMDAIVNFSWRGKKLRGTVIGFCVIQHDTPYYFIMIDKPIAGRNLCIVREEAVRKVIGAVVGEIDMNGGTIQYDMDDVQLGTRKHPVKIPDVKTVKEIRSHIKREL